MTYVTSQLWSSEMTKHIHPLMKNPNHRDSVIGRSKIDDVIFNAAPPIAWSDIGAALRPLRGFGQIGTGGFDKIDVM